MFGFFRNRKLKKKLKEKYGREVSSYDIDNARERMRRQNHFLDDSTTNVLMWMMVHGVDEDETQPESYSYDSRQDLDNTPSYDDTTKSTYTPSTDSVDTSSSYNSSSSYDSSSSYSSSSSDSGSSSSF